MSFLLIMSVIISTIPLETNLGDDNRLSMELTDVKYGSFSSPRNSYDYSTVYIQPFSLMTVMNGYSNYSAGNRWVCDDFTLEFDADIREIVIYEGYPEGSNLADYLNVIISEDDTCDSDPNTNTVVWQACLPCSNLFIGNI